MAVIFQSLPVISLQLGKPSQKVPVTLVDETDLKTLETGVTSPTIAISKNGVAYASASDGTITEIGNGDYTVTLNATDTDAVGWLLLRVVKASQTAETHVVCKISIDAAEEAALAERVRTFARETVGR